MPDLNKWLSEAKASAKAAGCGMYLIHNGVVRESARAEVRGGIPSPKVKGMTVHCDRELLDQVISTALSMDGIKYIKTDVFEGQLAVGDDIMYVMVGGDTRPHVMNCMDSLLNSIKTICITETEY